MVKSSLFIFSAGKTPSQLESMGLQLTLSITKTNIHLQSRNRDTDIENKRVHEEGKEDRVGRIRRLGLTYIHY